MVIVTSNQLAIICKNEKIEKLSVIAETLNELCPEYGIKNVDIFQEFIANVLHESGEFSIKSENMNYTTARRIVDVWSTRFSLSNINGKLNANNYVRSPVALANIVYNGRMGNKIGTSDGYNFRGAGYLQMTGRESFEAFANHIGYKDTLESLATRIRSEERLAIHAAIFEYSVALKLNDISVGDSNFERICRRINGGTIGIESRRRYFDIVKRVIKK